MYGKQFYYKNVLQMIFNSLKCLEEYFIIKMYSECFWVVSKIYCKLIWIISNIL